MKLLNFLLCSFTPLVDVIYFVYIISLKIVKNIFPCIFLFASFLYIFHFGVIYIYICF